MGSAHPEEHYQLCCLMGHQAYFPALAGRKGTYVRVWKCVNYRDRYKGRSDVRFVLEYGATRKEKWRMEFGEKGAYIAALVGMILPTVIGFFSCLACNGLSFSACLPAWLGCWLYLGSRYTTRYGLLAIRLHNEAGSNRGHMGK